VVLESSERIAFILSLAFHGHWQSGLELVIEELTFVIVFFLWRSSTQGEFQELISSPSFNILFIE
jgi:hypothetical protein